MAPGQRFDTFLNILAITQLPLPNPIREPSDPFLKAVRIIKYEQTAEACSFYKYMPLDARTLRERVPAGNRCSASNHYTRSSGQLRINRVADQQYCRNKRLCLADIQPPKPRQGHPTCNRWLR